MDARTLSLRDGMFQTRLFQAGSGEPVLYLHSSGGLQEQSCLDKLAQRFTVYAPEHPGFGESTGLEQVDDIIDLALYYHDLMDTLQIESAHVIGHSLGGMLAAEMAALCSHRVRKLVLVDAVGFWRDEDPILDFFAVPAAELGQYVYHDPQSAAVRASLQIPDEPDALMERLFQHLQSLTAAGKFLWPIPDRGLKKRIHRIKAPTLILWGESDRLVGPGYAEDFRSRIRDARVVILKECGHMPLSEQPEEFVSVVTDFLRS
jgi:pimeloyl-ACP methyl ester carboxylesterase